MRGIANLVTGSRLVASAAMLLLPAIPTCAIATFAAVQEGHLIRTGELR